MSKLNRLSFLRKLIGKNVFVIFDYKKFDGGPCKIENIKNEDNISVFSFEKNITLTTNIFNIRSLPYEW